ncbi:hypothetical protein SAMN05216428_102353 [Nitrosospira sp. Nsp11]|nr:hypothetical protein SAMN05216428_102353 [Nitrosospira sp. Nsp11]
MIGKGKLALAAAFGLSATSIFDPMIAKNDGIARLGSGPSGSPKRNQERSIKRQAQRSRVINRMRGR